MPEVRLNCAVNVGSSPDEPTTVTCRIVADSPDLEVPAGARLAGHRGAVYTLSEVDADNPRLLRFIGNDLAEGYWPERDHLEWIAPMFGTVVVDVEDSGGYGGGGVPMFLGDPGEAPPAPPHYYGASWAAPTDVAQVLNLRNPDLERLQRHLATANRLIVRALDRPATAPDLWPVPIELVSAEVQVAARLYMTEANPLGVVSTATDTVHYGADPLVGVWPLLAAYSYNRGVR